MEKYKNLMNDSLLLSAVKEIMRSYVEWYDVEYATIVNLI